MIHAIIILQLLRFFSSSVFGPSTRRHCFTSHTLRPLDEGQVTTSCWSGRSSTSLATLQARWIEPTRMLPRTTEMIKWCYYFIYASQDNSLVKEINCCATGKKSVTRGLRSEINYSRFLLLRGRVHIYLKQTHALLWVISGPKSWAAQRGSHHLILLCSLFGLRMRN